MTQLCDKAFVLAAGQGMRMRPLTENCPKPLLEVAGQPIIDYVLDSLVHAGVQEVVVNLSYLGDMLAEHLEKRQDLEITLSWEEERLETGGGVKKEISRFGDEAFYVLNADVIWTEGAVPALTRLAETWDAQAMDLLLLVQPMERAVNFTGPGDYHVLEDGQLRRRIEEPRADYAFAGPRIVHPRLFENAPDGAFSFLQLFDKAEAAGRLYGVVHDAEWFDVGTPEGLRKTDTVLRERAAA